MTAATCCIRGGVGGDSPPFPLFSKTYPTPTASFSLFRKATKGFFWVPRGERGKGDTEHRPACRKEEREGGREHNDAFVTVQNKTEEEGGGDGMDALAFKRTPASIMAEKDLPPPFTVTDKR